MLRLHPSVACRSGGFFDITSAFLPDVDGVYFNHLILQDAHVAQVRTALFKRIVSSRAWERHVRKRSSSDRSANSI
jgi:hypothetical protein